MIQRLRHWRYLPTVVTVLIVASFYMVSQTTGFAASLKAWLDQQPAVVIAIRLGLILFLLAGGVAWVLEPSRTQDGRPTLGSRLLVLFAFAVAAIQIVVLFVGNPFK